MDEKDFLHQTAEFRNRLMCTLTSLMESGAITDRSSEEVGQVVDMVKDLAETEMYISKKDYYDSMCHKTGSEAHVESHDPVKVLRDIWGSSDPDHKRKMREDIMKIINETA